MRCLVGFMLAICLFSSPAPARGQSWEIDPDHSQAVFTIEHVVGYVSGFFNEFNFRDKNLESTIVFDPENPGEAAIDVVINTWSLQSGVQRRDKHLATREFFDSLTYPVIRFTSKEVDKKGENRFEARGELTIKDVTRTVSVPFTYLGSEPNPAPGDDRLKGGIRGTITVNRMDYHVGPGKFLQIGLLGDEVRMDVYLELFEKKEGSSK